jgi:transglutaminase-like putative cysteine protease
VTSEFSVRVDRASPEAEDASPVITDVRSQALADRGLTARDPANYLFASPIAAMTQEIAEWAASWLAGDNRVMAAAAGLMRAIHFEFAYDSKATKADTPPLEAFRARRGVCQDFAHIMIIALRHFGIPAAYVSGYLRTNPPPGRARLVGADATHAWVNVWCGASLGWIGFDPTNSMLVGNDHIFTAMGRDFADVSPLDGVFIGRAGQRMKVSVEVTPLDL